MRIQEEHHLGGQLVESLLITTIKSAEVLEGSTGSLQTLVGVRSVPLRHMQVAD